MPSNLDLVIAKAETILAQCLVAANQAATAAASIGAAGLAPLNSPLFTGDPRVPLQPGNSASDSIASTAWIAGKFGQPSGLATLDVNGLIPLAQLPFSGLTYDGTWNASTNDPQLVSSFGTAGHFFVVTVAGTTSLNGITSWAVGDWALFSSVWTRLPYTAPPISNLPLSSLEGINAKTFVGNNGTTSAAPSAIAISSILSSLAVVTTGGSGLCPTLPGGTGVYLRGDGNYASPGAPDLSAYALLNSPSFTGTATVATQARGLASSAIASTLFVTQQQADVAEVSLIKVNGTTSAGTSTYAAKADHIHGTDTSRVAASNPSTSGTFTHSGSGSVSGTLTVAVLAASLLSATNGTVSGTLTLHNVNLNGTLSAQNTNVNGTATIQDLTVNGTMTGGGTIPSGVVVFTILSAAPSGWLMFNDSTLGDGSSGASHANADSLNVFTELFNNASDANCPIFTSGGGGTTRAAQGNAAAAWAAHCRMSLPKALGRALAVAGSGSGLTARAMAGTVGAETHQLTVNEMPSHHHIAALQGSANVTAGFPNLGVDQGVSTVTGDTGGDAAHNNMQPSTFLNAMVKL